MEQTNYQRLISLTQEEMEQELIRIVNWSTKQIKEVVNNSDFMKEWLDKEAQGEKTK